MNVNKLLRFLLSRVLTMGIVEAGGGSAEVVEDDPDVDVEGAEAGDQEGEAAEDDDAKASEAGEDTDGTEAEGDGSTTDEVVITIGDEEPPAEEDEGKRSSWVTDLRHRNRELVRKQREQEAEIERLKGAQGAPAAVVVGPEPELEEFADAEQIAKYKTDLSAWHERKRQADTSASEKKRVEAAAKAAWQVKLDAYTKAKTSLKVKDFEDAEDTVKDTLSITQQGILLNGANKPELLVYALGKNLKRLKDLGAISDPVKFAFAAANVERDLKVTPRKSAPPPERTVRSSVAGAAAVDNQLERLRAEAAKTGDSTKVIAYKTAQREKKRA